MEYRQNITYLQVIISISNHFFRLEINVTFLNIFCLAYLIVEYTMFHNVSFIVPYVLCGVRVPGEYLQ